MYEVTMTKKVLFFLTLLFSSNAHSDVLMLIRDDVYTNYQQFLNGRDVLEVNNFSSPFIRRDVVDMIIVQQALELGGFKHKFRYGKGKVNYRNKQLLIKGQLLLSFDSYWLADASELTEHVYVSAPVIRNGEYFAGIFANPNHPKVFQIKQIEDLKQFTAVSTSNWKTDWQTLSELPLKELIEESSWVSQARMVEEMWVDFFLVPFYSSKEDIYEFDNIRLKHVPQIAVLLKDSRHFVISKKHPLGAEAINAIDKGLALMRSQGKIVKAYTEAGFFIDPSKYHIINQ